MTSHSLRRQRARSQQDNDRSRGIRFEFIWLGTPVLPVGRDSNSSLYTCSWRRGHYECHSKGHTGEFSSSPPMEFEIEINDPRWEVDEYRIEIGYMEGHNHDMTNLVPRDCKSYVWESITKATHAVDVDKPWHLRRRLAVPTDEFLPAKPDNPRGKVTVFINIFRQGFEKDNLKPAANRPLPGFFSKGSKRTPSDSSTNSRILRLDDIDKPLTTSIYKICFEEIKEEPQEELAPLRTTSPQPLPLASGFLTPDTIKDMAGQPKPLAHIDEDIKIMTSYEKDMEIMRLRRITTIMKATENSESLALPVQLRLPESQKIFFPRDMSRVGL
ncbi:hypothetical protein TWF730_008035 [Orbilia blumenaviensis]|uniref:Uncharacterized protein n=1 Tax=Orbilia blumenaviensis TaxID=1796055 RepID=A0AAV9VBC2_9PEZI